MKKIYLDNQIIRDVVYSIGETYQEVGNKLGVSKQAIDDLIYGKERQNPRRLTMRRWKVLIAKACFPNHNINKRVGEVQIAHPDETEYFDIAKSLGFSIDYTHLVEVDQVGLCLCISEEEFEKFEVEDKDFYKNNGVVGIITYPTSYGNLPKYHQL